MDDFAGGTGASAIAPTVVSGAAPEDVIAAVWFGMGRRPVDSLVLAALQGPEQRLGPMLRGDLVPPAGPGPGRAVLRRLLERLLEEDAVTGVVALVCADRALDVPARRLAARIHAAAGDVGVPLLDVLGVTPDAFRSLLCRDPLCCAPGGRPVVDVESSRAAATHVLHGHPMAPPAPSSEVAPAPIPVAAGAGAPDRIDWYLRWCRATAAGDGEPVPGLAGALHDGRLRDALLLALVGADGRWINETLDDRVPAGESVLAADDERAVARLEAVFTRRPDVERLRRGEVVLTAALTVAEPGERGPGLAVLALVAWLDGRLARAGALVADALVTGPPLHLARLVAELLARGVEPPWAEA